MALLDDAVRVEQALLQRGEEVLAGRGHGGCGTSRRSRSRGAAQSQAGARSSFEAADRPPDIMLPPAARALVRTTPSLARLANRAVLSVTGSQAADFLNGIVSSSIAASSTQSPAHFYTAFLHAQASPPSLTQ